MKKIKLLIKLGKAAKAITGVGIGIGASTAIVSEDPQTTQIALLISLVSIIADIVISYLKGKENGKVIKDLEEKK